MAKVHDCIIIGAGPAGLTAAIYLARFRRDVIVFDAGTSRARFIPITFNYPGFPNGVSGKALLNKLKSQAKGYGTQLIEKAVTSIELDQNKHFMVVSSGAQLRAKRILLATGVTDFIPDAPGSKLLLRRGFLRLCPICDGYEAINKRVGVIGNTNHGLAETGFLMQFTQKICLLMHGQTMRMSKQKIMRYKNLQLLAPTIKRFTLRKDEVVVLFSDGHTKNFDLIYAALGVSINNQLVRKLPLQLSSEGYIQTDRKQQTNIPNLYAAGDIVKGLSQLSVAVGQAAVASVAIQHSLLDKN